MQLTLLSGYPDFVGRRSIWCGYGQGPEHYSRTEKDPLHVPPFSYFVDAIIPAVSSSGRYMVYGVAEGVGARQEWKLKWVKASGEDAGEEVENNHDLSEETVQLAGFGGQF